MWTAPWRPLSAALEMAAMTSFGAFFDYGSYDDQIVCNGKKFYVTLNYFKLIEFTFKFRLCITHLIILMRFNLALLFI